ncbi:MAG: hypothetical protein KC587_14185, partial [Nitrospira sp.]|nr:hypothetical protein [Nitrospira sp.]
MKTTELKIELIDEPELCFGHDQKATFAKDGLLWFGPIDDVQKPTTMRVGFVGSPKGMHFYQSWVKQINLPILGAKDAAHHMPFPGFEAIFSTQWPEKPVCALTVAEKKLLETIHIKDRHQAIYNTVTLFENEIRRYINEEDSGVDLWFVVIPEDVHTYGRPQSRVPGSIAGAAPAKMNTKLAKKLGAEPSLFEEDNSLAEIYHYELNFHNQLKARLLDTKAVVQVVRETTLAPEAFIVNGRETRRLQDKASVAWNLCTTAYFKASGRPWRLANVRPGVCYVGLVFKQDETSHDTRNACCGAQMFLDSGDGVVFFFFLRPRYSSDTGEFHIPREKAQVIAEKVVEAYCRDHGHPPSELFIHGTTRLNRDEWQGFCDGVPDGTNIVSIQIRNEGRLKLYSSNDHPLARGMYL